jgi:signal transduction histidine kinase/ActR/RegA family two-component response regulator
MASGDLSHRAALSETHDELDAIAFAVNVIVGELAYATSRLERAKTEAETANQAKSEFLRDMSHEIRTPLGVILGAAELLRSPRTDAEKRDGLSKRILKQGRALAALIDDLLDLSKVEAQRLTFDTREMRPHGVIVDVLTSLEDEARDRQVTLTASGAAEVGAMADERRLRQILMNVVGNAVKFTHGGEVRVHEAIADDPTLVWIDVIDNGIGIEAAQAAKLFEAFHQAHPSMSKHLGGTGLGLMLSKRLAVAMGGDLLLIESAVGKGATFRIVLRAAQPVAAAPSQTAIGALSTTKLDGLRILLVEDEADMRGVAVDLLKATGASVLDVSDGLAAIEVASMDPFDVILMDLCMPEPNGLETTRRLRALGVRTPILALTAGALAVAEDEWRSAGCDGLVPKPIDVARLVSTIHAIRERSYSSASRQDAES